jgi:hypothetical protein
MKDLEDFEYESTCHDITVLQYAENEALGPFSAPLDPSRYLLAEGVDRLIGTVCGTRDYFAQDGEVGVTGKRLSNGGDYVLFGIFGLATPEMATTVVRLVHELQGLAATTELTVEDIRFGVA